MKGRTKENDEGKKRQADALKGRTKENNKSKKATSEKLTGRTKENYEGLRIISEKLTGQTKENDESVRKRAELLAGRTKEEYEYLKNHSNLMKSRTGEETPNWRGGISFEPYCEKFDENLKERIREFFGRCCYVCGMNEVDNGERLSVHHVNYNKDTCCDNSKPLFVPLCRNCHSKTQGDREYWKEFFTVSLNYLTDGKCFYTKEEIINKNNFYKNRI